MAPTIFEPQVTIIWDKRRLRSRPWSEALVLVKWAFRLNRAEYLAAKIILGL